MAGEQNVQVAPDSTGKKIRTLELDLQIADASGVLAKSTVEAQVVVVCDAKGQLIDLNDLKAALAEFTAELRALRRGLKETTNNLAFGREGD